MIFVIFAIICFVILYSDAYFSGNYNYQLIVIIALWLFDAIYALFNLNKRIVFFSFLLSFLLFLLGDLIVYNLEEIHSVDKSVLFEFKGDILSHIYLSLFISLLGLLIGVIVFEKKDNNYITYNVNTQEILSIRRITKKLVYFLFVFQLLVEVEKLLFVSATSYVDLYVTFRSQLPIIVHRLASFYNYSLLLFLASMPTIKDARIPILLNLTLAIFPLLYGQRTNFGLIIFFLLIYLIIRKSLSIYNDGNQWFNKRYAIMFLISLPFLFVGLYAISFIRQGDSFSNTDFTSSFLSMLSQQGGTLRLVGLERVYSEQLNQGFPFSFGFALDFFQNSLINKQLGILPYYEPQTIEMALNGHSFGSAITYLDNTNYYLSGGGYGSCYVAEAFHDFGYLGLFLINVIYGVVFNFFNRRISSIWQFFFALLIIQNIIVVPRGDCFDFLSCFFSIMLYVYILILWKISKSSTIRKKNRLSIIRRRIMQGTEE